MQTLNYQAISDWLQYVDKIPDLLTRGILFSGDRASCCDEAIIALLGEELIGMASISPRGEIGAGGPEIVGIWARRNHRRQGVATKLLEKAISRCLERGFDEINVCCISKASYQLCHKLEWNYKRYLKIQDFSGGLLEL